MPLLALAVVVAEWGAAVQGQIRDVHAEPLAMQAGGEVPVFLSFTTGAHPAYGMADIDNGTIRTL